MNEPRNRDVSAQDGRINSHRQRAQFERHAGVCPLVDENCWSLERRKQGRDPSVTVDKGGREGEVERTLNPPAKLRASCSEMLVTKKSLKTNQGEATSWSSSSAGTEEEKRKGMIVSSTRETRGKIERTLDDGDQVSILGSRLNLDDQSLKEKEGYPVSEVTRKRYKAQTHPQIVNSNSLSPGRLLLRTLDPEIVLPRNDSERRRQEELRLRASRRSLLDPDVLKMLGRVNGGVDGDDGREDRAFCEDASSSKRSVLLAGDADDLGGDISSDGGVEDGREVFGDGSFVREGLRKA